MQDWTTQIRLKKLAKFAFARRGFWSSSIMLGTGETSDPEEMRIGQQPICHVSCSLA